MQLPGPLILGKSELNHGDKKESGFNMNMPGVKINLELLALNRQLKQY